MPNSKLYSNEEIKKWLKYDKLDQKTAKKIKLQFRQKSLQKRKNSPSKTPAQNHAPRRIFAKFMIIKKMPQFISIKLKELGQVP